MNTISKLIATTALAFGTMGAAQAGQFITDEYPGPFATFTQQEIDNAKAKADDSQYPYVFQGEFLVDNPKYRSAAKPLTRAEVRAAIPASRRFDYISIGG